MRLFSALLLGMMLLPVVLAAPRDDSTKAIDGGDAGTIYVSVCRGFPTTNADPAVELVDDCTTSGVYQESNLIPGLQVRAGVDENGRAFPADTTLVSGQDL